MLIIPAFEAFIAPARDDCALWRTITTFLLGLLVYIFWTAIVLICVAVFFMDDFGVTFSMVSLISGLERGDTPFYMAALLATFIPMAGAAMLMATIHDRSPLGLFGIRKNFIRNFVFTAAIILALNLILLAYDRTMGADDLTSNLPTAEWATYLVWALPLLLIQITAEELVFRGFLLQQLAARFKNPIWWMVLPSVLFGLGHIDPTIDPTLAVIVVVATTMFGIIAVDLTRITGNLGAAMGLHFANNFLAMMVIATPDKMSGLSLFHSSYTMQDSEVMIPLMGIGIVLLGVVWLIARRVLR